MSQLSSAAMATEGESLKQENTKKGEIQKVKLPATVAEAQQIVDRFEAAAPAEAKEMNDSIRHHVLQSGGSIMDERWYGSAEEERDAFVQEELYIHSKLLIVDDRRVLIGSANINDRSQNGDHDSEIAIVIEDNDTIESTMNGHKVRRHALSLDADRRSTSPPSSPRRSVASSGGSTSA